MKRFSGRIALVTGATSGIGRACAMRLADEGAIVYAADRRPPETSAEASSAIHGHVLDVADTAGWQGLVARLEAAHARLHVLVNCAGIVTAGDSSDPMGACLPEIRAIHGVNFEGAWLGMRACTDLLAREGGAIVNVASRAAEVGVPSAPAYAASKAALVSLTRSAALHFAGLRLAVRCNAVLPGSIDTPLWRPLGEDAQLGREAALQKGLPNVPLGRLGAPDEVAAAILFLASDDASYITGATLNVDGGQVAN